jgi:peptide/nickel transport system substrate-binding protein
VYRIGWPTKVEELAEAVAAYVSKTGLKVTLAPAELAQWRQFDRLSGPGPGKPDVFVTSHGNDMMDSGSSFDTYYRCQGLISLSCVPEIEAKIGPAAAKSGAEREKAFQDLWVEAAEHYVTFGLLSLDYVHGIAPNLSWEPRTDGYVLYNTFRFTD